MMKRKKIRVIMAGIFCIGVLMGGLGTGIAFAELSGFAYQPVTASPETFLTETFTYALSADEKEKIWIRRYLGDAIVKIREDGEFPEGQMEIGITYNTEACSIKFVDYRDAEDEIHLQFYLNSGGDFERLMKFKDDFLEGLRKKELRDYQVECIKSVEILINPQDRERIHWN